MIRVLPNGHQAVLAALVCACLSAGVTLGSTQNLAQVDPPPSPPLDRPKLANRLSEIGPLLSRCLQMPDYDIAQPGMQITVRLAFTRDGQILGEPRFTFSSPGVSPEVRAVYQRAVVDMLNRCTPLPITKELGEAIAGRPFVIPIVETRKEKKADITHDPAS
ncbi:MAG TPA: hypothetical protein VLJ17_18245 [Xanthobacteraceae bacterium]|nr:hypothetical protein [Xanthobacteraceae bacterium]